MLGLFCLSSGYYDAYYLKIKDKSTYHRSLIRHLKSMILSLAPAAPTTAPLKAAYRILSKMYLRIFIQYLQILPESQVYQFRAEKTIRVFQLNAASWRCFQEKHYFLQVLRMKRQERRVKRDGTVYETVIGLEVW